MLCLLYLTASLHTWRARNITSWYLFMKFLNIYALSFWFDNLTSSSLCLSSSCRTGILSSSSYLVASNLSFTLLYLIASKTLFRSISVRVPSIFCTSSSFLAKYFSFLEFSHQLFHVLNLTISLSAYAFMTWSFIAKNTFCLNHILVISSLICSYLCSSSCLFVWANHMTNACLVYAFFFRYIIVNIKSDCDSFLRQISLQWQIYLRRVLASLPSENLRKTFSPSILRPWFLSLWRYAFLH